MVNDDQGRSRRLERFTNGHDFQEAGPGDQRHDEVSGIPNPFGPNFTSMAENKSTRKLDFLIYECDTVVWRFMPQPLPADN